VKPTVSNVRRGPAFGVVACFGPLWPCLAVLAVALATQASAQVQLAASVSSHVYGGGGSPAAQCGSPISGDPCATLVCNPGGPGRWSANASACADYGVLRVVAVATSPDGFSCSGEAAATFYDELVVVGRAGSFDVYFDFDVDGATSGPVQACDAGNTDPSPHQRACLTVNVGSATPPSRTVNLSDSPVGVTRVGPFQMTSGSLYHVSVSLAARAISGAGSPESPRTSIVDFSSGDRGVRLRPLVVENGGEPVQCARARGRSCHQYLGPEFERDKLGRVLPLFVSKTGGDCAPGQSWPDALDSLQDALMLAKLPCGVNEIWVARGTYVPGAGRASSYVLVNGVTIYGGFFGDESSPDERDIDANPTVLSGDLNADDAPGFLNRDDNVFHVVRGVVVGCCGIFATLDGLTISGGNANATDGIDQDGGGIHAYGSSLTLKGCRLTDNSARTLGGAVRIYSFSPGETVTTIEDSVFEGNRVQTGSGGAIEFNAGTLTLRNTRMVDNRAGTHGSGGAIHSGRPIIAEGCSFEGNIAQGPSSGGQGGAISLFGPSSFSDCSFEANTAMQGGAIGVALPSGALLEMERCTFDGNAATNGSGGAVNAAPSAGVPASVIVRDSVFSRNSATASGGAVYNNQSTLSLSVSESEFLGNSAGMSGGAIRLPTSVSSCTFLGNTSAAGGAISSSGGSITNCEFAWNSSAVGGAVRNGPFGLLRMTNCTLTRNAAPAGMGGAISATGVSGGLMLRNSIVWDNTGGQIAGAASLLDVEFNDIMGGLAGEPNNIDADPLMHRVPGAGDDGVWGTPDDDTGDLTLGAGSACVDAGNNSSVPAGTLVDLAGSPRFVDDPCVDDTGLGVAPIVDMGAYEFQGKSCVPCPADFNGDGTVNSTDVSDFINQWFQDQVEGTLVTDWDHNGVVNSTDVSGFINSWFEDTAAGCG